MNTLSQKKFFRIPLFHTTNLIIFITGVNNTLSFEELKEVGDKLVEKVQTGELAQEAQVEVVSLSVSDPIPEPVDPTGGVRATNETGK